MALPNASVVKAAVESLYSAFANDKTEGTAKAGVEALNEVANKLNPLYPVVEKTIVDAADANVAAWITADAAIAVVVVVRTLSATADLTNNALATAKGSALAVGDIFVIATGTTVVYLGNNDGIPFDFAGETTQDFG